jgi:hypothetical protein
MFFLLQQHLFKFDAPQEGFKSEVFYEFYSTLWLVHQSSSSIHLSLILDPFSLLSHTQAHLRHGLSFLTATLQFLLHPIAHKS